MGKGYVIKNMPGINVSCQSVSNPADRIKMYLELLNNK